MRCERIRNDQALEQNAREQWAKACRSMPLQGAGTTASLPPLWLELKPIRADRRAADHQRDRGDRHRRHRGRDPHHADRDQADCPFPDKISIVPPTAAGISIGVPIDLPFTEHQQDPGSDNSRADIPGGRLRLGRRHRQKSQCRGGRRPAADLAVGACEREEELVRFRRRRHRSHLGPSGARPGAPDRCG